MNARKRARASRTTTPGRAPSARVAFGDGEEDQEEEEEVIARAARGRSGAVDALARRSRRASPRGSPARRGVRKLAALRAILLALASRATDAGGERAVVVSSFSAAVDSAGALCASLGLATDRLDGRTPPEVRSGLVREFNAGRGGRVMFAVVRRRRRGAPNGPISRRESDWCSSTRAGTRRTTTRRWRACGATGPYSGR